MERTLKKMFVAIEVNLLLWLAVFGATLGNDAQPGAKPLVIVGLVFSAVVQHWAYYACYKKAKEIAVPEP